jgi:hypothetical protein
MNNTLKRCIHCVLSENFPKIEFDKNGMCNFCREELFHSTEKAYIEEANDVISGMIKKEKGSSEYDAIVCYSGGKDSTLTLKLAVEKYKLKILAFTLENGFTSPEANLNIERVVSTLGVDHITFRPSQKFMRNLYRVSSLHEIYNKKTLTRISANCNSCISIVNNIALKYALEKDIPFILSGFTLGQIPLNAIYYTTNYSFLKESRQYFMDKLTTLLGDEVTKYMGISDQIINRIKKYPVNINLLCLESYTEKEIIEEIMPLGWVQPKDVDGCSSNCRINAFNNYVHEQKYGYSPYELELSHLIRKKLLSREEALKKLLDQPMEQIKYAMDVLQINDSQIVNVSL